MSWSWKINIYLVWVYLQYRWYLLRLDAICPVQTSAFGMHVVSSSLPIPLNFLKSVVVVRGSAIRLCLKMKEYIWTPLTLEFALTSLIFVNPNGSVLGNTKILLSMAICPFIYPWSMRLIVMPTKSSASHSMKSSPVTAAARRKNGVAVCAT